MQLLFVLACISLAELTSALHIPVTAHKRTTTTQGSGVPTSRQSLLTSVPLSVGQLNITNLDILVSILGYPDGRHVGTATLSYLDYLVYHSRDNRRSR